MLSSRKRLSRRIEQILVLLIAAGALLVFVQHVPLWTAGVGAFVVLVASAWAGV
jgi:membrane protein YdbS with pleckstrin-like domain